MSGKDILIDFISYVVALLMFIFVLFFIILGGRFEVVKEFFLNIIPLMIFALVAIIVLNLRRKDIKKKKNESNYDITLYLNYGDRMGSDIVFTGLPVLILLLGLSMGGSIKIDDVIQSLLVFFILYFYFKALYNKTG